MKSWNRCPKCGGTLTAVYNERRDYPVQSVISNAERTNNRTSVINADSEGVCEDSTLRHVACDKCGRYWHDLQDFVRDGIEWDKKVEAANGRIVFTAISNGELLNGEYVHAGDEIECACGEWHELKAGIVTGPGGVDRGGGVLYFRCGGNVYLAALNNRMVLNAGDVRVRTR